MRKIEQLFKEINNKRIDHSIIKYREGHLSVEFLSGRKQRVFINRKDKYYKLWSVILGKSKVEEYGEVDLIEYIWQRNRQTDMVGFYIDKKGRLVGAIKQLAETIDLDELIFYLHILAKECDRLEYLFSGKDLN